jgi:hypothetical protein
MKLPIGQGIWPAFWMMPTYELYDGWPESGENDIIENIGSEPSTVHGTPRFGEPWPNNCQASGSCFLPDGQHFIDSFHIFAIEKEPGVTGRGIQMPRLFFHKPLRSTTSGSTTAPASTSPATARSTTVKAASSTRWATPPPTPYLPGRWRRHL